MQNEIKYLGNSINLKSIRDFIIDNELDSNKVILLNQKNFDDLILEHLDYYKESMKVPFEYVGVFIDEDYLGKVPKDSIGIFEEEELEYDYFSQDNY